MKTVHWMVKMRCLFSLVGLFLLPPLQAEDAAGVSAETQAGTGKTVRAVSAPDSENEGNAPSDETQDSDASSSAKPQGATAASSSGKDADPEDSAGTVESRSVNPILSGDHEWIDSTHSWVYNTSQNSIAWFDGLFVGEDEEKIETPPSRFRLGLFTEFDFGAAEDFKLVPVVDLSTDIELPNLERRLKVFVSTRDPTALPDEDATEANDGLRIGAARDFFKHWSTSAGVKARWPPELFANVSWSRIYELPNRWVIYPKFKPFWDTKRGFGTVVSSVVDHWRGRWLFRQSVSGKWDQENQEDDREAAEDPTSSQFGQDGEGYRWSVSSVIGYIPLLLDETEYGRRISSSDVADGWGLRGRVDGNISQVLSYDLTLFRKAPLYKDFVFYVVAPEVQWEQDNNWKAEYSIQVGIEVLLWGQKTTKSSDDF